MSVSPNIPVSGIKIIVVLMLSVVTIVLFNTIDRYQISGNELLVNNNFDSKFESWKKMGVGISLSGNSQPIVRLVSENNRGTVAIRQTLPEVIKKRKPVRFSGVLKTRSVGRGDKVWKAARMIFVGLDETGHSLYNVPHVLVMRNGTNDWEHFSRVFYPSSHASSYYVELQLVNVKGVMWVKELSLKPVEETLAFSVYWKISVLMWAVVSLWILVPFRRAIFASKWSILVIVLVIVALFGGLMSSDLKNSAMKWMNLYIPWIYGEAGFFRVGHFLVYSLLSVVVFWRAQPGRQEVVRFGLLALFAMVTEILQFLVDGRTPRVSDFFVDIAGMALGLLISRLFSNYKSGNKDSSQYY